MRFFWISAGKDLRRMRRDAPSLVAWFLLPLVVAGLMGLVFGRQDVKPRGLLLMADEDAGLSGTFVRESISRSALGRMLAMQQVDRAEGRARLDRGDGSALLVIPKSYDKAVQNDEPAEMVLVLNPEQRILTRVIREGVAGMVDALHYVQQAAGPELRALDRLPSTPASLAGLAGDSGRTLIAAGRYLRPPHIAIKNNVVAVYDPIPTVMAMLFPGMILLVVFLSAEGMSLDIWKERRAGAVRRLAATPAGVHTFLAGKLAATSGVFLLAVTVLFAVARLLFDVPMRSPLLAVAWAAGSALVLYLGLLVVQLLIANDRTATTVASAIVFPLAVLGGCFFPLEIMPEGFARAARMTPNGWMLVQLKSILAGSAGIARVTEAFAALSLAGVLAFMVAARLLKRRFAA